MAEQTKALNIKRAQIKSKVTRFRTYLDSIEISRDISQLKQRLAKFEECWTDFELVQNEIELTNDSDLELSQEREIFENTYFELVAKAEAFLATPSTSNVPNSFSTSDSNNIQVKLPTIKLPTFSGKYEDWLQFSELFQSLIHANTSLSVIQKFHYLKTSLQGQASSVIESLEISAANYDTAWALLKQRFENKRVIVNRHVTAIFYAEKIDRESGQALRHLLDNFNKHLRALETLGEPVDKWDTLIIHTIAKKLDFNTFRQWENQLLSTNMPTLAELTKFLENRCQTLEAIDNNKIKNNPPPSYSLKPQTKNRTNNSTFATSITKCRLCNGNHQIFQCQEFINLSIHNRLQKVRTLGLCINCLSKNHLIKDCMSSKCKHCDRKHNTLLHLSSQQNPTPNKDKGVSISSSSSPQATLSSQTHKHQILLSTAIVDIEDIYGVKHECRVLLDSASQSNFITEKMVQKIKLAKNKSYTSITGIGENQSKVSHSVNCTIHSRHNAYKVSLNCLVLPTITQDLPSVQFNASKWNIPKTLSLADVNFNTPGTIDMLIGAELFFRLLCVGQIKPHKYGPIFQKTSLGWIATGKVGNDNSKQDESLCHLSTDDSLHFQFQKFWEIEECESGAKEANTEHLLCEAHFIQTTTRDSSGQYTVDLPIKENISQLGNSQKMAETRFLQLEKKLIQNPSLHKAYSDFMDEYENLGHMEVVDNEVDDTSKVSYYIPHLAVIREASSTTKVRVVFDASAKSSTGLSLNDTLMAGPTIQQDIFSILCRFRCHKYVLTADIEKMYRQIKVNSHQTNLQRILWRRNTTEPIKINRLKTVTYGTTPAPFLAVRTLHQLAMDEQQAWPIASKVTLTDFYVDDLMTGAETLVDVKIIQTQVTELLKSGGFNIRKWNSNASEVLKNIPVEARAQTQEHTEEQSVKVLGMSWTAESDSFQYYVKKNNTFSKITKRAILSEIASLFDPLGLLGPIILKAKILIQDLWQLNLKWDESIPAALHSSWQDYRRQLSFLTDLQVKRHAMVGQPDKIELHGFCDASERAYGACIFIRTTRGDEEISVNLLCSKSRVAPLKKTTIPRLELCGALLLAKLVSKIMSIFIQLDSCTLWCDSTIVLAWINASPTNWKTFVANRVSEIQELTMNNNCSWKHVRTSNNPADLVSRGLNPVQILNCNLWWHGPVWLGDSPDSWPTLETNRVVDLPEQRKTKISLATIVSQPLIDISRYSSFLKLQRVTATCLRFINNLRDQINKKSGPLQSIELKEAIAYLVKTEQQNHLTEDYTRIRSRKQVKKNSSLHTLQPFIDNAGLIRVGGRLQNAQIHPDQKHPILLPSKSHLTELIAKHEHLRNLHAGPQLLLSVLRQQYWPLRGRDIVRKIVHNCVRCFRTNPKTTQPQMGSLPASRLLLSRPFTNTGTDLCGPVKIRSSRRRNSLETKGYVVLFVCFSTRAIHLELASDMTTDAFLAAFKRFISRRGICSNIYSDNGTNFVGANKELKVLRNLFKSEEHQKRVIEETSPQQITWHFIPPRSPHFGGLWEAGIKSMKYHLKRVVGNASLTYEEYNTILTMIEACLNSRPLTPLSNDPNDYFPLTPGHFLTGDALTSLPEPSLIHIPNTRLSNWQRTQQLTQHFWSRWSKEYLSFMQQRPKWNSKSVNIQPGQLVIVKDDCLPPLRWITARVVEVHPGADDKVRVATIRTASGTFKRATNRLCILPLEPTNQ